MIALPPQCPAVSGRRLGGRARFRGVLRRRDQPFRQRQRRRRRRGWAGRLGGWPVFTRRRQHFLGLGCAGRRREALRRAILDRHRAASSGRSVGLLGHAGRCWRAGEVGAGREDGPRGHGEEPRLVVAAGSRDRRTRGGSRNGPVATGARPPGAAPHARLAGASRRLARVGTLGLAAVGLRVLLAASGHPGDPIQFQCEIAADDDAVSRPLPRTARVGRDQTASHDQPDGAISRQFSHGPSPTKGGILDSDARYPGARIGMRAAAVLGIIVADRPF